MTDLSITDTHARNIEAAPTAENLLATHLDIWTTAIEQKSSAGRGSSNKFSLYGIKKLRELILELAVRGKLVPQDANDEPASVLLERIATEKAQLVKEGKLKKQKPLPEISEDEKPFELPQGWAWARLGEYAEVKGGKRLPKGHTLINEQTEYAYIRVTDMKDGTVNLHGLQYLTADTQKLIQQYTISKNDLYITIAGTIGEVGSIPEELDGMNLTENAAKIIFSQIDRLWLKKSLSASFSMGQFIEKVNQLAQPKLALHRILSSILPVPPLEEQHRIVAKVDELMSLCDALEAQTEASISAHQILVETLLNALLLPQATANTASQSDISLEPSFTNRFDKDWQSVAEHFDTLFTTAASIDTLKQTILQLAVMGKLVPWGEGLRTGELKEYLSFGPRNGFSPKETSSATDVSVLKLGATTYGYLDLNQTKYVDIKVEDSSHLWLRDGDILIQRGNSANYVGCNCLIKMDVTGVIYPDLMMKLRTVKDLNPEFLSIWLSSPKSRQFMWDRMTGTSGTMPKISKKIVESIPVIIPSITVQTFIVAKVEELMALCEQLKACLADVQTTQLHLADAIVEQAV